MTKNTRLLMNICLLFCSIILLAFWLLDISGHIVQTSSLGERVQPKSLVFVRNASADSIKQNDILLFVQKPNNLLVLHKVSKIEGHSKNKTLVMTGEQENIGKPYRLIYNDVIGRYMIHIPHVGSFIELVVPYRFSVLILFFIATVLGVSYRVYKRKAPSDLPVNHSGVLSDTSKRSMD